MLTLTLDAMHQRFGTVFARRRPSCDQKLEYSKTPPGLLSTGSALKAAARIKRIPSQSGFRCFLGCFRSLCNLLLSFVASLLFKVHSPQHCLLHHLLVLLHVTVTVAANRQGGQSGLFLQLQPPTGLLPTATPPAATYQLEADAEACSSNKRVRASCSSLQVRWQELVLD